MTSASVPFAHNALHYVDVTRPGYERLAANFWSCLAGLDPCLSQPSPDTVGHAAGDHLHLQWWTDPTGLYFAAQVVDTQSLSQWEMFHVPAHEDMAIAGVRISWTSDPSAPVPASIWQATFGALLLDAIQDVAAPTFVELLSAGCSPQGVTAVRDEQARITHLESDLEYWSQLARTQAKALRNRSQPLQAWPAVETEVEVAQPPPVREWRLREIETWAAENSHRITILPRALSATKRSPYENEQFIYDCLELLATEYTQVKTNNADRFAFKDKADSMGLDYGGSVEPANRGTAGAQYIVRWGGRKRYLDQHLSKGIARDPRYCMRIYFFWDQTDQKVVVGSMPAHLDTGST